MNGLPGLRLLPDAPVPDGRTVITGADASRAPPVGGHRQHLTRFIPVTNAIEGLNRHVRKAIKTRGHFPDEQAATKLIYLALTRAQIKWKGVMHWTAALRALKIHFEDRIPD
jgi:transposase-like protein